MYPKFNSDGTLNENGHGKANSQRYRTRFFSKKAEEFFFHPQISKVHEVFDELGEIKNLDYDFREGKKIDLIDKWCALEFEPKLKSGVDAGKKFYLADQIPETDTEKEAYMQDPDTYGIAVTSNIINLIENQASVTFIRPLDPLLTDDIPLEEDQTYMAFINYGVFPSSETDRVYDLVRGQKGTSGENVPHSLLIMTALSSSYLTSSILTLALLI